MSVDSDEGLDDFKCPISLEIMKHPVMLIETGHSYEKSAIEAWLKKSCEDPLTGLPLSIKTVTPNHALRKSIQQSQEKRQQKRSLAQAPCSAAAASCPPPETRPSSAQPSVAQSAPRPSAAARQAGVAAFGTPSAAASTSPRITFGPFSGFPPPPVPPQPLGVSRIHLVRGDLLQCGAEAIVSSTSPTMRSLGGALERAIHACCGPALAAELAAELAALARASGRSDAPPCPAGAAVATSAPNMPHCQRIFHTVAPALDACMQMQPAVLASCYRSCLSLAAVHNVRSVAFPPLATGTLHFPRAAAAKVAVETVAAFAPRWRPDCRVELVAPDEATFLCLHAALQAAGYPKKQRLG